MKKSATTAAKRAATASASQARRTRLPKAPSFDTGDDDGICLLSKLEVITKTGLSYPSIWKLMREGAFPRSRALGGKTVWIKSEIEAFIAALPTRPLKGDERAA